MVQESQHINFLYISISVISISIWVFPSTHFPDPLLLPVVVSTPVTRLIPGLKSMVWVLFP